MASNQTGMVQGRHGGRGSGIDIARPDPRGGPRRYAVTVERVRGVSGQLD